MTSVLFTCLGLLLASDAGANRATVSAIKPAAALVSAANVLAMVLLWVVAARMGNRNGTANR